MSSFVDLAQLHPVVDFGIEELNSIGSTAHLLSGPRYKDVPVADLAAGVAVSCVLHPLHLLEFEVVVDGGLVWDELLAHEHGVWEGLVVAASEHENTGVLDAYLDHLEIVWEVASVFYVFVSKILSLGVEHCD